MDVTFDFFKDNLVVHISGEIDHHATEVLRTRIDKKLISEKSVNMILDLSDVSFMDSSGIGLIIGRFKNVRGFGGNLALVCKDNHIKRIVSLAGIEKIIEICNDIETAVNSLKIKNKKTAGL